MKFLRQPAFKIDKGKPRYDDSHHLTISTLAVLMLLAAGASAAQTKKNANTARPKSATVPKARTQSNATKSKPSAKSAGAAIFIVTQDRSGAHIAPLVGVIEARLIEPPSAESDSFSEFASRYYRAGQKYRLLFGGGERERSLSNPALIRKTTALALRQA